LFANYGIPLLVLALPAADGDPVFQCFAEYQNVFQEFPAFFIQMNLGDFLSRFRKVDPFRRIRANCARASAALTCIIHESRSPVSFLWERDKDVTKTEFG
jgi:hypothetical protein